VCEPRQVRKEAAISNYCVWYGSILPEL